MSSLLCAAKALSWLVLAVDPPAASGPTAAALAPQAAVAAQPASRVFFDGQSAQLALEEKPRRIILTLRAHSRVPVPVDWVEVGVLFAAVAENLQAAEPGALYKDGKGSTTVGILRARKDVRLPPGGQVWVELEAALDADAPDPRVFVTHVLGYGLADLTAPLLLELLDTDAAADEVAAVNVLGLAGESDDKLRARKRFSGRSDVAQALSTRALGTVAQPSQAETLGWVYAVRALAVLGGSASSTALDTLVTRDLGVYDEPLQVLRLARLTGSRLETPLAYAVPVDAKRAIDVVEASRKELAALALAATPVEASGPSAVAAPTDPGAAAGSSTGLLVALSVGVVMTTFGLLLFRRRGPRP